MAKHGEHDAPASTSPGTGTAANVAASQTKGRAPDKAAPLPPESIKEILLPERANAERWLRNLIIFCVVVLAIFDLAVVPFRCSLSSSAIVAVNVAFLGAGGLLGIAAKSIFSVYTKI